MKHFLLSLMAGAMLCTTAVAQNNVKNLYTHTGAFDYESLKNTEQTVQLNRFLFAGYNTICLPMSVSAEQLQAAVQGIRLERLIGMQQEGNMLNLYFLDCTDEGIEAGIPYLVCSPKTINLRLKNTEATNIGSELRNVWLSDDKGNSISFGSSWETVRKDGLYGIPAKQETMPLESILIRTEADKAFLPTRCGFYWESQASSATQLNIKHITSLSEATGISKIEGSKLDAQNAIYDLSGRKVNNAKKGIYIQNGKKVLK